MVSVQLVIMLMRISQEQGAENMMFSRAQQFPESPICVPVSLAILILARLTSTNESDRVGGFKLWRCLRHEADLT
jgi:hypothetical protein